MPKRKTVDAAKLIKLIEDETPQAEIMKKMGFKTSTQVKTAYMNALIAVGKAVAIKGVVVPVKLRRPNWLMSANEAAS